MSVIGVVKQHPYMIGGAAIGVFAIVFIVAGSGKSSGSGGSVVAVPSGPSDAAYASDAAVQSAQIARASRQDELTTALNVAVLANQQNQDTLTAQLAAAKLVSDAQVRALEIDAAAKMNEDALSANVALASLNLQGAIALGAQETTRVVEQQREETTRYMIGQQSAERANEIAAMLEMQVSNNNTQLALADMNAKQLAEQNALTKYSIDKQAEYASHQLDVAAEVDARNTAAQQEINQRIIDAQNTQNAMNAFLMLYSMSRG